MLFVYKIPCLFGFVIRLTKIYLLLLDLNAPTNFSVQAVFYGGSNVINRD